MGGPSQHGQRNKAHKSGRRAGPSARDKHRQKKDAAGPPSSRASIKSAAHSSKLDRAHASKQQRDTKRQELLEARRRNSAPLVVALLPLSDAADVGHTWSGLLTAAAGGGGSGSDASSSSSMVTVLAQGRHKMRLTLLKAPADRNDPLALVDVAKAADVLLLLVSGSSSTAAVDDAGSSNLAVLRALGLPSCMAVVTSTHQHQHQQQHGIAGDADAMEDSEDPTAGAAAAAGDAGAAGGAAQKLSSAGLRERSAAKKRAEKALQQHLPGDLKLMHGDSLQDMQQVLRALADSTPQVPVWRRQRPYLLVQGAAFVPQQQQTPQDFLQQQQPAQHEGVVGELHLTGYIRAQGLSANQLVTVPGAGDFRTLRIEGPPEPTLQQQQKQQRKGGGAGGGGDMDMSDAVGVGAGRVLALPDPDQQEVLVRENEADPLAGEQTWPTEEELSAAAAAAAAGRRMRKRRLPAGTSEYQAAWILDDDDEDGSDSEGVSEEDLQDYAMGVDASAAPPAALPLHHQLDHLDQEDLQTEGDEGDAMEYNIMDEDEEAEQDAARRLQEELKQKRLAEAEDAEYPDEVDTPQDMAARLRFAKYRGLKSFRSSPWDAREGLPAEYGRVFAFENFKRTAKRAREAAACCTSGTDPCAVLPGSYVTLVLADVPAAAAQAVVQRTAATTTAAADDDIMADAAGAAAHGAAAVPLVVFGLLQHEAKLSVLNFGLKKVSGLSDSIRNKEELLFVTGVRSFLARPLLSDDGTGADKHKMERFMQPGSSLVGSVYGPITYPPTPLLAFKVVPGSPHVVLAAAGALRSVDPDRLVIKKIVLTGYPVRVHKTRAVVRLMFFNPDDVRWFKPLELWTKSGRRGRITEPLGTHGAFKARFDGPISQRDAVCLSLYKRVFPKWPAAAAVAAGAWQQQQQGGGGPPAGSDAVSLSGMPAALGMNSFA